MTLVISPLISSLTNSISSLDLCECMSEDMAKVILYYVKKNNKELITFERIKRYLYVSLSKKVEQFKLLTYFDNFLYLFCGCGHSIILDTCIYIKKCFDIIKNI